MNINFGLLPPADAPALDATGKRLKGKDKTRAKKHSVSLRALADLESWLAAQPSTRVAAE